MSGLRQKKITLSVSLVTYQQIEKLAEQRGIMASDYIRKLVIQHLIDLGLPIYFDVDAQQREAEKAENAGQEK